MTVYRRALSYVRPDAGLVALLVCLIGVSVAASLLEAWPVAVLIDSVLTQRPVEDAVHRAFLALLPESRPGQIVGLVLMGAGLQVVTYATWLARMMINYRLNYFATARVRNDLFGKLLELGPAYHRASPQGDAIFRLTFDAFGPWNLVDLMIGTGVAVLTLTAMTAILLARNVPLTIAAFSVAPFVLASNWWFARRIHARTLDQKAVDTGLTSYIQQAVATIELTQAFGREPSAFEAFGAWLRRSIAASLRLNWQEQLYPFVRDVILAVSAGIIFGYGGWLVYRDQFVTPVAGGMTVGTLLIFMDYARKLWEPLKWVTEFVAKAAFHVAASERVYAILDTPTPVRDSPGARALPVAPRRLAFEAVRFSYGPDRAPVLDGVSAAIRPGESVAFLGPSGTGKSTLLSLMLRFYDPTGGAIRLDGVDLREIRLADLRRHFALVGQDSPVLPASVAENIGFGRPGASRRAIERAAELAGAAEFVAALPHGFDTVLAEGGRNLSGGQRQRIAIARALLTEAPFLLLDEPTSALDPAHEAHLVATLRAIKGRRTIVLVTHRLETTADCDRIFEMAAGRIVREGTPAEVLGAACRS